MAEDQFKRADGQGEFYSRYQQSDNRIKHEEFVDIFGRPTTTYPHVHILYHYKRGSTEVDSVDIVASTASGIHPARRQLTGDISGGDVQAATLEMRRLLYDNLGLEQKHLALRQNQKLWRVLEQAAAKIVRSLDEQLDEWERKKIALVATKNATAEQLQKVEELTNRVAERVKTQRAKALDTLIMRFSFDDIQK